MDNHIQKYSSLSLSKVENKIAITEKVISSSNIIQIKKYWKDKLNTFRREGKWEKILDESNNCIKQFPDWDFGYLLRGIAEGNFKDYLHAIGDFDKAIMYDDKCKKAFYHRGIANMEIHNYKGALKDLNKNIELDNENAEGYLFRGEVKIKMGDNTNAMEDFNKAIEICGTNPDFYIIRGYHKENSGDIQGAFVDKLKADELENKRHDKKVTNSFGNLTIDEIATPRILIIDDDEIICYLLKEKFDKVFGKEYQTDYSLRGEEGLRLIRQNKYSIVILNLLMPGIQGEEVLVLIKKFDPSIPVIIFTSALHRKDECLKKGAAAYIRKPGFGELLETMKPLFLQKN